MNDIAITLIVLGVAVGATEVVISLRSLLMAVTVSAAASLSTPVATPVNMTVIGRGGNEFGDYWRLGVPALLLFVAVETFLVPVVWAF